MAVGRRVWGGEKLGEVRLADPPGQAAECRGSQPGPLVPPQSSLQRGPQQRAAALGGTEDPTINASLYKNVQHSFPVPNMMHEKFFENDKNAQRPPFCLAESAYKNLSQKRIAVALPSHPGRLMVPLPSSLFPDLRGQERAYHFQDKGPHPEGTLVSERK